MTCIAWNCFSLLLDVSVMCSDGYYGFMCNAHCQGLNPIATCDSHGHLNCTTSGMDAIVCDNYILNRNHVFTYKRKITRLVFFYINVQVSFGPFFYNTWLYWYFKPCNEYHKILFLDKLSWKAVSTDYNSQKTVYWHYFYLKRGRRNTIILRPYTTVIAKYQPTWTRLSHNRACFRRRHTGLLQTRQPVLPVWHHVQHTPVRSQGSL